MTVEASSARAGFDSGEGRAGLYSSIELAEALSDNLSAVVLGTPLALLTATAAVLAGGHLLIEDVPGVGKTMLAKAISASIGARLARVQGHPDLLPSDITGVSVYSAATREWEFRPGPVFSHVVLFDELNRTPPRSQSALLETMEEQQVSVDGKTFPLPYPHLVLATENPAGQAGTYPLVESQVDRFLLSTHLGYPDEETEITLAQGRGTRSALDHLSPICTPGELAAVQRQIAESVAVVDEVARYAVALVRASRTAPGVRLGASPRAAIGLLAAARARAVIGGRGYVTPADVQEIAPSCLAHRLVTDGGGAASTTIGRQIVARLLDTVAVPRP
jgi:MoxR-like ATPase